MFRSPNINSNNEQYKRITFIFLIIFICLSPILEGISNEVLPIGTKYIGFLLIGIWIFESIHYNRLFLNNSLILLLIYLFLVTLSAIWSYNQSLTVSRIVTIFQLILLYWIIIDVCRRRTNLINIIASYILSVFLLTLTALVNIINGSTYQGLFNRYSAIGYDPNNFAIMLVSSIPLAVFYFSYKKKPIIGAFYILLSVIVSVATASRGAFLDLGLIFLMYFLTSLNSLKKIIYMTAIIIIGLVSINNFVPKESLNRIMLSIDDQSAGGRTSAWDLAIDVGSEHPFTGIGSGAFFAYSEHTGLGIVVHNTFLSNWAELGIFGFLLWVLIWILHFKFIAFSRVKSKEDKEFKKTIMIFFISILIGSLFLNWEIRKPLYILWGVATCFGVINTQRKLQPD